MGISTLLLNAFIIIICILSYQVFWLDKAERKPRNHILISFFSSIAIVLCMTFPIHLHDGYIYDLRFIPFLLVILYGNKRSIVFTGIVYIAYRFYLGGNGFFSSVIISTIITTITIILRYFLPVYFRRNKVLFNTLLLLSCTSSFSAFAIMNEIKIYGKIETVFIWFLINYVVVNAFTGL
ncbi:LytS/YhcK type 5TM receptor domain-containing protein, partial [Bacillus pseudomycoides]